MGDMFVSGICIDVYRQFPDATCLRKAFGSWQQGATPGNAIYWHWLLQGHGNKQHSEHQHEYYVASPLSFSALACAKLHLVGPLTTFCH
jgi:hypothetical protein